MPDAAFFSELEGPGVVVENTRFMLKGIKPRTWSCRIGSDGGLTTFDDKDPEEPLTADRVRDLMSNLGGEDGLHGEELHITASQDLRDRFAGIVENMQAKERLHEGEAITYSTEDQHAISGLNGEEAETLQMVLDWMRKNAEAAVLMLDPEEKQVHRKFTEALDAGALPIYLTPEAAAKCIRRREDGTPVLAWGRFPETEIADALAYGIDKALREAEPPLREVSLEGTVELGDGDEVLLPDQPMIGGKVVVREIEDLRRSVVSCVLRQGTLTKVAATGRLEANAEGYKAEGDEEPPVAMVEHFDLLAYLHEMEGETVSLMVRETERESHGVQPATEYEPKTPEEDLIGKTRVALAAGKLIQANRTYMETPDGVPDNPGTPSRKNDTAVDRLTEALAWAEADADEKAGPS